MYIILYSFTYEKQRNKYIMRIFQKLIILLVFMGVFVFIVAYARGYRFSLKQKTFNSTGIIAATSQPKAAKVYINGELKGVTDNTFILPPDIYTVEIKKDGYTDWKKTFSLKGELVVSADATLFPLNASLTPLTNLGLAKVISIDNTERSLLFSQNGIEEKDGIYLFDQNKKPFSFFPPLKLLVLKKNLPKEVDFVNTQITFSPDFKEAILDFQLENGNISYLISIDEENKQLFDVTNSKDSLISAWETENQKGKIKIMEIFPIDIRKIASDSFSVISFSPDKTKLLYKAKKTGVLPLFIKPPLIATNQEKEDRNLSEGELYIYDKKEDKNFKVKGLESIAEEIESVLTWYIDSHHLILNDGQHLTIMEYDNTNKQIVYSGLYLSDFVDVAPDGRLLILANFNPQTNKFPDIYAVGIR